MFTNKVMEPGSSSSAVNRPEYEDLSSNMHMGSELEDELSSSEDELPTSRSLASSACKRFTAKQRRILTAYYKMGMKGVGIKQTGRRIFKTIDKQVSASTKYIHVHCIYIHRTPAGSSIPCL